MSAFAVVYERSNTPVEPGVLERVMARLSERGPDGRDVCVTEQAALGHWHFWTTPEEKGERQPLELAGLPFNIVLDGRLDNRPELIKELNINLAESSRLSDAALVLHAYDRWKENCFEHFIGEYALVILDQFRGVLLCGRDALGERTLFYASKGTRVVVASEAWAVAGADARGEELNERAAAYYFALKATEDGQTLFNNIFELLPAHAMQVDSSGQRIWRYWEPDWSRRVRYNSDEGYAEEFRALLEESVRCRMRSTTSVGVLMSGGLDSTSLACLAARMQKPQPLTTISYVFDELTDCDERKYIEAVKELWGIHSIQIPCDDAWPFKDWPNWPQNPNQPDWNIYRLPKERAYQCAHNEGLSVLMTGEMGDQLYAAERNFLADLITDGRLSDAGRELSLHIRVRGLRRTWQAGYLQRVAARLANLAPSKGRLHSNPTSHPIWLTPYSDGLLSQPGTSVYPAVEKQPAMLGLRVARNCAAETCYASRHVVEQRNPYRDRRLIEFVLALPAYQLYYRGFIKYILRRAMQDILPDVIRTRNKPTRLISLFFRGIERENAVLRTFFQDPGAAWRRFVLADWLLERWNVAFPPEQDGPQALVPWLTFSFEAWYKTYTLSN